MKKQKIKEKVITEQVIEENYPKEKKISGTRKECDEQLSALRSDYIVEITRISNHDNLIEYYLLIMKK